MDTLKGMLHRFLGFGRRGLRSFFGVFMVAILVLAMTTGCGYGKTGSKPQSFSDEFVYETARKDISEPHFI